MPCFQRGRHRNPVSVSGDSSLRTLFSFGCQPITRFREELEPLEPVVTVNFTQLKMASPFQGFGSLQVYVGTFPAELIVPKTVGTTLMPGTNLVGVASLETRTTWESLRYNFLSKGRFDVGRQLFICVVGSNTFSSGINSSRLKR